MVRLLSSGLAWCAVLALASPSWGATAVPRIRSVNLSEVDLNLLSSLLSSSYEKFSGERVTMGLEGATEVIEALAYGLGPNATLPFLLRVQRRSELGVVLAQAELRLETLEDAPVVFDRIAQSLVDRIPLDATLIRHNVARAQARPQARLATEVILGVKLWFVTPLAVGCVFNSLGVIMLDGRFEKETYFFELGAGALIPGPSASPSSHAYAGVVGELGASRYLSGGDTALYAGGGVLPRLLFSPGIDDSPFNLAPYGQLGLMVDRSSSMRLYADVRVAQNILPIRVSNLAGQPRGAYPTELSGQIGIGW